MFLRIAYTIFIGILLTTFVGVGIAAFYEAHQMPKSRNVPYVQKLDSELTPEEKRAQDLQAQKDQKEWETYTVENKKYNRDVSIIAVVSAVIILGSGLVLVRHINLISDGLVLGGVLTLGYSIIRGFQADNNKTQFVIVSVGLAIALLLGYLKFVKPQIKIKKH